jgi:hypothetical protein
MGAAQYGCSMLASPTLLGIFGSGRENCIPRTRRRPGEEPKMHDYLNHIARAFLWRRKTPADLLALQKFRLARARPRPRADTGAGTRTASRKAEEEGTAQKPSNPQTFSIPPSGLTPENMTRVRDRAVGRSAGTPDMTPLGSISRISHVARHRLHAGLGESGASSENQGGDSGLHDRKGSGANGWSGAYSPREGGF